MSTPEEVEDPVRIPTWVEFTLVAVGGATGAVGRWLTAEVVTATPSGFPVATLGVNVIGCALIGVAAATLGRTVEHRRSRAEWWFAVSGVLGGFTTFSSFAVETDRLVSNGRFITAASYLAATLIAGLFATYAAMAALDAPTLPSGTEEVE